jgi:excisionase family DNA binding protein
VTDEYGRRADDSSNALLVRLPDAAHLLGVSLSTIERLVASGQLPSVKLGRRRLVARTAIDDIVRRALWIDHI